MAEERRGATGGAFLFALDSEGEGVRQYERGGLPSAKWVPLNTGRGGLPMQQTQIEPPPGEDRRLAERADAVLS